MSKNVLMEIVAKVVGLLEPLKPEERFRAIKSALTILGEPSEKLKVNGEGSDDPELLGDSKPNASAWLKQNKITHEELQQVFHNADGTFSVISGVPGKNKREQTLNAYVLEGIKTLLATGKAYFDDQSARDLCESSGCYDTTNHAKILKNKGNLFTGTKEKGWTLTAPGLKHGAALIKEVSKTPE
jgi:hypothetical protein